MPEVKFGVKFMDWQKGDKAGIPKRLAEQYTRMGVCKLVRTPAKRTKKVAPPNNKRAVAASNK